MATKMAIKTKPRPYSLLFVANGAPGGSNLTVHEITGTIKLPDEGREGTLDDPLSLPATTRGLQPATQAVRGVGPDGEPATPDDVDVLKPGEQAQVEFVPFAGGRHRERPGRGECVVHGDRRR